MCGMVPCGSEPDAAAGTRATGRRSSRCPAANASEYAMSAQMMPTNPSAMKLIIIVLSAFFERTSPP